MLYRMYVITDTGRRTFPMDVDCSTDAEAREAATEIALPRQLVEVWDGTRFVSQASQRPERVLGE